MGKNRENMRGTYFISSISTTTFLVEYGISSIFTLFLLYVLDFSIPLTSHVYGYYYGFAYLLPILIGYISDKYLNKSTSLTIGFLSMIISQVILCFSASLDAPINPIQDTIVFNLQNTTYFIGLMFLALGTSFSSLSIMHIINSINNESSRVKGFSIYYPILNIGILIGVIITTVVVGDENYDLFEWIFFIFTIILIIGLINFRLGKNKYLVDNDGNPMKDNYPNEDPMNKERSNFFANISRENTFKIEKLNFKQRIKLFRDSLTQHEKDRLTVFFIFLMIIIFYRIAYSQSSISLIFFIDTYVQRDLSFYTIPVQMFSMLNPMFILILGFIFIKVNDKLEEKKIELNFMKRTILALLIILLCYTILTVIGYYIDIGSVDKISVIWIVVFEFFIAVSEILFSIAGYSLVGNLAPEKYNSLFFGFFLATRSIAMFLSGFISSHFPQEEADFIFNLPINGLMTFFITFVIIITITALVLIINRKKLIEKMHLEDLNSE